MNMPKIWWKDMKCESQKNPQEACRIFIYPNRYESHNYAKIYLITNRYRMWQRWTKPRRRRPTKDRLDSSIFCFIPWTGLFFSSCYFSFPKSCTPHFLLCRHLWVFLFYPLRGIIFLAFYFSIIVFLAFYVVRIYILLDIIFMKVIFWDNELMFKLIYFLQTR